MSRRHAFSLIEMLVATVLVAVLMGGVVMLLGGVNRDVRAMRQKEAAPQLGALMELIDRDIANARTIVPAGDRRTLELVGNAAIDRRTLRSDGRLARVTYRLERSGELRREQRYLDAPDRPEPWDELAAVGIESLSLVQRGEGAPNARLVVETRQGAVGVDVRLR